MPDLKDGWPKSARNCARDRLRKQRLETVPIDEVRSHTLEISDAADAHLIRDEQRELIRRAMKTLSQKDREIARAYYLDGASYDELIRTHGLSYKAISFRLSRAKRTLTKRLSHLLSGVFIPPATTLKKISSGGFTAMKIGTAPKITGRGDSNHCYWRLHRLTPTAIAREEIRHHRLRLRRQQPTSPEQSVARD